MLPARLWEIPSSFLCSLFVSKLTAIVGERNLRGQRIVKMSVLWMLQGFKKLGCHVAHYIMCSVYQTLHTLNVFVSHCLEDTLIATVSRILHLTYYSTVVLKSLCLSLLGNTLILDHPAVISELFMAKLVENRQCLKILCSCIVLLVLPPALALIS